MDDEMLRLETLKIAAQIASPTDDIGNVVAHADWLSKYVRTGARPEEGENESSTVARRDVVTA